jgi:hypothetical protein
MPPLLSCRYGFQPHRVALWIYWHAVLLLWKGVPFYGCGCACVACCMQCVLCGHAALLTECACLFYAARPAQISRQQQTLLRATPKLPMAAPLSGDQRSSGLGMRCDVWCN